MNLNILIIVTAHGALGNTGAVTGLWFEELTTPYYAFADSGARVDIVTLSGGQVPIDPRSMNPDSKLPDSVDRFLKDKDALEQVRNSKKLAEVSFEDYEAVYIPGGHGAMWDLAASPELGRFLTRAWARGLIIASVCHGPAGLIKAKDTDGQPLVAGKMVSAFSDSEEENMGLSNVVPFLLESKLRQLGADYRSGPDFAPFALRDGRLITGQNPASSEKVAEMVLEASKELKN